MFGPTHAQQIAGNASFMPYCARCVQNGWEICRRGSGKTARNSVAENSIDEGLKKEESARQLVQNDSATMKIRRFSSAVEVPYAVRPARPFERMQAEPSRDHRQELLHVLTISLSQARWNSKDVSLMTKDAVRKDSQKVRSRTSSMICRRWDQTKTEQGIWPTKTLSMCGSRVRPIWQR